MRFLTLFVEKVVKHPQIKQVPEDVKKANKEKVIEILNITEKVKSKLLDRFQKEYDQYLIDQENEKKRAIEEAKRKVTNLHFSAIYNAKLFVFRNSKMPSREQLEILLNHHNQQLYHPFFLRHQISQTWIKLFIQTTFLQETILTNQVASYLARNHCLIDLLNLHYHSWKAV